MATVAIVGPGAVGGVIAALLGKAGHDVTLCARRAIGDVTVALLSGDTKLAAPVLTDPAQGRPVDWILVATKAYDAAGAAAWFP
ncbi:MAG: 2-dehydropantoate 2-reductase N-terminal domain-containing protein, partial [Oleiharenicola lentus]